LGPAVHASPRWSEITTHLPNNLHSDEGTFSRYSRSKVATLWHMQATKKSCQEAMPPLSKYSEHGHATHDVEYSSYLTRGEGGEEEEVPPGDRLKAYLVSPCLTYSQALSL